MTAKNLQRQRQKKKQIPGGNDRKKGKSKGIGEGISIIEIVVGGGA